jgi:hypothetical protein
VCRRYAREELTVEARIAALHRSVGKLVIDHAPTIAPISATDERFSDIAVWD